MKRNILLLLLIFSTISVVKGQSPGETRMSDNDTIARIEYPERIEIKTSGDSVRIMAKGMRDGYGYGEFVYTYASADAYSDDGDWEVNLPFVSSFREKKHVRKSGCRFKVEWFDNFYVGGVMGVDKPAGMKGGWEIGVDNFVGLFCHTGRRGPVFSLGAGLGYRSMNYGDGMMLSQAGKVLEIVPAAEEIQSASSRLHLFRLSIPFMITQPLVCGVSLRAGAILNLNTYASATTKIKTSSKNTKESFHSLEQRFATPDFLGSLVLFDNFGVYVRWSPVSLFSGEWGPRYKAVSVGVNFVL